MSISKNEDYDNPKCIGALNDGAIERFVQEVEAVRSRVLGLLILNSRTTQSHGPLATQY
jgi:hypothetical protein